MTEDKKEIDLEEMESIAGGGDGNTYSNSNDGGKQFQQQGENNTIKNNGGTINFGGK